MKSKCLLQTIQSCLIGLVWPNMATEIKSEYMYGTYREFWESEISDTKLQRSETIMINCTWINIFQPFWKRDVKNCWSAPWPSLRPQKKNVSCQNMSLLWNSSVDIVTNNSQYTTTCTNLHPTGEIYFLTPLDVSFPKGTKVLFSVTNGILKSPNPRNRNSISVIKSKFLSVSSMNTLLAILKVTDARRDVILVGGLYHRFPWRHLPLRFYKQDRRFRILRFSSVAM